jgi:hypothetical protein
VSWKEELILNLNQDLTPQERVDDELLRHLLGAPGLSAERGNCGCCEHGGDIPAAVTVGASCPMPAQPHTDTAHDGFGIYGGILAALYMPLQQYDDLYDEETALRRGTLFRALDLPFYGGREGKFCE